MKVWKKEKRKRNRHTLYLRICAKFTGTNFQYSFWVPSETGTVVVIFEAAFFALIAKKKMILGKWKNLGFDADIEKMLDQLLTVYR